MQPDVPRPFRIVARRRETSRVVTLTVEPLDGQPFTCHAGQFNMLAAFGHGDVPISVSACHGPIRHTIAEVGLATAALGALRTGATLGLRGPFGHGWPLRAAFGQDLLIVAGGVGLAPLRPVLDQSARFRRLALVVGTRRPRDLLYRRQLARWHSPLVTVDVADTGWHGRVGTVLPLLPEALARLDRESCQVFLCGPEIMLRLACRDLIRLGVPPAHLHVSLERNMKCAYGVCGHCQLGPKLVCRDGPVFAYPEVGALLEVREL